MRHFIIGILFLFVIGCSKSEKSKCYECKSAVESKEGPIIRSFSNSTNTYCDKDESEIKAFEEKNTYVKTENGVTTTATCNCQQK